MFNIEKDFIAYRSYQSGLPFNVYFDRHGISKYKDGSIRVRAENNGAFIQVGFTSKKKFSYFKTKTKDIEVFGYDNIKLLEDFIAKNYLIIFSHWHHILDEVSLFDALYYSKNNYVISAAIIKAIKEF